MPLFARCTRIKYLIASLIIVSKPQVAVCLLLPCTVQEISFAGFICSVFL